MIYKRCSRCGKRIPTGTTCDCIKQRHREYDLYSRDKKAAAFYHSPAWERMRQHILDKYDGIDVYLYVVSGQVVPATTVHHIVPIQDDDNYKLSESNLIPVSSGTHNMIHTAYKSSRTDKLQMQKVLRDCLVRFT